MKTLPIAAFSVLLGSLGVAQAAPPLASVTCTGGSATVTFNASFYRIGIEDETTGTGSGSGSGAGAGKLTLQPFITHSALQSFQTLFDAAGSGTHFSSCLIRTQDSAGGTLQFNLKNVIVEEVTATASAASERTPRFAFVKTEFEFEQVQVVTSGAADDGGVGPSAE